MMHTLPELPYAKTALEPHMSAQTLDFHHGKHHNAYVTNLNNLIEGTDFADMALEDIIEKTKMSKEHVGIFNNAAQVWNHTFFWNSMKPNGGVVPHGKIAEMIDGSFGSLADFKAAFKKAATTQFGSGWAWLVQDGTQLKIVQTGNAETPLTSSMTPILTCDVWEHAYYLDHQNKRPDYVDTFLNHLINWDFANANLK